YLGYLGMQMDDVREQMRPNAEKQVKMRLALEHIVKQEGLTISDEELDAEFAKLAEQYRMDVEAVKNAINGDDLRSDLAVEKAITFVRDNADITDEQ
ncbi:MAG: trigger factor, partial [Clostridia bacterium]|nr:trigger factor [Clostridia bacterium]